MANLSCLEQAEKLVDFSQKLDIQLLDAVVNVSVLKCVKFI